MRLPALLIALALTAGCGSDDPEASATATATAAPAPIVADAGTAAAWISDALSSSGYRADFSPESAWELDRFFDEQLEGPGKPRRRGLLSEDLGARLFAIGAYTGEVIRRNADGWTWAAAPDDPDDEVHLQLKHGDDQVIWPVQRAMKRYGEGAESSIAAYVHGVAGLDVGPKP